MRSKLQICSVFCVFAAALSTALPAEGARLSTRESAVVTYINAFRDVNQLQPLSVDFELVKAAREHSRAMLRDDVFAHGNFVGRMRAQGVTASVAAENLAWGTGTLGTARGIVDAWLASPPHRANLLHPRFRWIGISAPRGWFAGHRDATVATADFAG